MSNLTSTNLDLKNLIATCRSEAEIKERLLAHGIPNDKINHHLELIRKARFARRQTSGIYWMVTGSVIGFIGCILSITNPVPDLFHVILYGLTPLSVILVFMGLYLFLEA
jgi:hypothetical protein